MLGAQRAEAERVCIAQPEVAVETCQPTVTIHELPVGEDRAEERFGVQVVSNTTDEGLSRLFEPRVERVIHGTRRFVVGVHNAHRGPSHLACQLRAIPRVDNRPCMYQGHRCTNLENLGTLEEERPKLGKEQSKPLVDLDLRSV